MSNTLHIGQSDFKGSFANYTQKLNFLELLAEPQRLPKLARLQEYRAQAPEGFQFAVVLSPKVLSGGSTGQALLDYGLQVVRTLRPRWLVVRSPASLRPSSAGERELSSVFSQVRPELGESGLAWEPRGLWQPAQAARFAEKCGVLPVSDARELLPGDLAYVRLLHVGTGTRASGRSIEQLALGLLQTREAYLVIDGGPALPIKRQLLAIFEEAGLETDADDQEWETSDVSPGDADEESDLDEEELGEEAEEAADDDESADDLEAEEAELGDEENDEADSAERSGRGGRT